MKKLSKRDILSAVLASVITIILGNFFHFLFFGHFLIRNPVALFFGAVIFSVTWLLLIIYKKKKNANN